MLRRDSGGLSKRALPRLLAFLCGVLVCAPAAQSAPEDDLVRVRTEASAPGVGVCARDAAVKNAERAVLTQVLETMVGEEGMAGLASLLESPGRYVRSTRLLRHEETPGKTTVEIETYVRRKTLQIEAAKLLLRRLPWPPKALVLAAERVGEGAAFIAAENGVGQKTLEDGLRKHGVLLADQTSVRGRYTEAQLLERIRGDLDTACAFAQEHLVDAVVLAEVTALAEPVVNGAGMHRTRATVTARVFRPGDGKLLEALAEQAVVHSRNPVEGSIQAIRDACAKVRDPVTIATVLATVHAKDDQNIILTIESPGSRPRFQEIVRVIQETPGVKALDELYFAEAEARLRIDYDGRMAHFVEHLTAHRYCGFALEAQRVIARQVTLTLIPTLATDN